MLRVVRRVVEEHETHAHGIAKVEHVQGGRRLIQPVAIAAAIEAEQATDEEPKALSGKTETLSSGRWRNGLFNITLIGLSN